jgi:hypothetical protein
MRRWWTPGLGRYLLRHPSDALTLIRAGWRLRRDGWLRHPPFLPLPGSDYWHFRVTTVNGTSGYSPGPTAMVEAAAWALRQPVGRPT